jgi:hypothetical protein
MAAATSATGVIRRAFLSPQWSDSHPSTAGETASPRACIIKILTAKARARIAGAVTFTITVLRGPVFRNKKNSAKKIVARQALTEGVTRA